MLGLVMCPYSITRLVLHVSCHLGIHLDSWVVQSPRKVEVVVMMPNAKQLNGWFRVNITMTKARIINALKLINKCTSL
jgi:hypothetical protein